MPDTQPIVTLHTVYKVMLEIQKQTERWGYDRTRIEELEKENNELRAQLVTVREQLSAIRAIGAIATVVFGGLVAYLFDKI